MAVKCNPTNEKFEKPVKGNGKLSEAECKAEANKMQVKAN